ncbi:hypothetical protein JCM10213_000620 [Rhodosporidiobolus nylandii]
MSSETLLEQLHSAATEHGPRKLPLELLEAVQRKLEDEARSLKAGSGDVEETLFADPFPLIRLLLPSVSSARARQAQTATAVAALRLLARWASAKEVVLGVGEAVDEVKAGGGVGDEEEWASDAERPEEDEKDEPRDRARWMAVLTDMYSLALPRIATKKPLKFLTPAIEPLGEAVAMLVLEGASKEPGPENGEGEGDAVAGEVFASVAGLAKAVLAGGWLERAEEGTRVVVVALLSTLLFETTAFLHPFFPSSLASRFFYSHFPKYRLPSRTMRDSAPVDGVWAVTEPLLDPLGFTPPHLFSLSTSRLAAPHQRIGAFVLLSHLLSSRPSPALSNLSTSRDFSELLRSTLGVLKMPLDNPMLRLGEDEALFWAWWCVERGIEEGKGGLEDEVLFPLIEILSTHAALSPSPQTRFLSFRLISRLLLCCTGTGAKDEGDAGETTQMMLLKGLVADSPFEPLRVAAVGLVKEVVGQKLAEAEENVTSSLPLLLTPLFLSEFGASLFNLELAATTPEAPEATPFSELNADEFVEKQHSIIMERLGLYYFLLQRDRRNLTGLASPLTLASHESIFLAPLRSRLQEWLASPAAAADATMAFQLELVQSMLERVDEAVERRKRA